MSEHVSKQIPPPERMPRRKAEPKVQSPKFENLVFGICAVRVRGAGGRYYEKNVHAGPRPTVEAYLSHLANMNPRNIYFMLPQNSLHEPNETGEL